MRLGFGVEVLGLRSYGWGDGVQWRALVTHDALALNEAADTRDGKRADGDAAVGDDVRRAEKGHTGASHRESRR